MQPEGLLPHPQEPATSAYHEPHPSSPGSQPTSPRSILILSSRPHLSLSSGLHPSGFPTKTLYASVLFFVRATCPAYPSVLYLITRMIFGEEYRA
jgi:hypothetical protein